MKIGFFIAVISVLLSFNSYVIVRGWQALPSESAFRPIYIIGMILLFVAMMGGLIFGNNMPLGVARVVGFVGFSYFLIFAYLMLSFLAIDIIRIINYYLHVLPTSLVTLRLWVMIGTLAITGIAMILGNYKFNHPSIVNLNLSIENPRQHKELKIVAASDIHLGINIGKKRLQDYVKMINDQHPDIVLLAGDISDRSMAPVINQRMIEEFRAIKAPLGVFAINGNHEHYAETSTATADYLQKAGVIYLRDEVILVDSSFYLVGRDDRSNLKRKNLSEIVRGLDENKPRILLDHQPYHLEIARQNNIDLQISGHTHNGQFFPGNLFVKRMYELGYGYKKKGKTHYYVSSGLGLWGPQYRIGTQSEIVVINLKY